MISVRIIKKLNIRKGPGTSFESIGTIPASGAPVDMDGETNGEPHKGINKWYFKINDKNEKQYYWGGGIEEINTPAPAPKEVPNITNWWIVDYGIPALWNKTRGEKIKIAIIDTGLYYDHTSIRSKKNISFYNIFNNSTKPEDCIDLDGHGTHCAGMIAAQGPDVFGIAPDCDLIIIKATINKDLSCANAAAAIDAAVKLRANIISMSYEYNNDDDNFDKLKAASENANNNNVLIVSSTGNGGRARLISDVYPASFDFSIGVGAVDKNKNFWDKTTLTNKMVILAPGVDIQLLSLNNQVITDSGTSYAAPFIAGICALYLSLNQSSDHNSLKNRMKTTAINSENIFSQIKKLYDSDFTDSKLGIISPQSLI